MAAPPGKTFIKLADGRTIAVASEDAARYEYFSDGGKVLRRPRAPAPAPPPKPASRERLSAADDEFAPVSDSPAPAWSAAPARAPPAPSPPPPRVPPPAPFTPPPPPPPLPVYRPPPAAPPPPRPAPAASAPARRRAAAAPPRSGATTRQRPPGSRRPLPFNSPALTYDLRALIVTGIIAALVFTSLPVFEKYVDIALHLNPATFNQRTFPAVSEFNITRSFTMSAPGGTVSYSLNLAIPYHIPGQQNLVEVIENPGHTAESNKWWWNGTVASGSSTTISVRYHVIMTTYIWDVKEADVGTTADVPGSYGVYLDEEWKISPASASVRSLANQITSPTKNYLTQLDDLYTWLLKTYSYQTTANFEPQSPEETMARSGGDCDDFSVLFISMARYLGIPAWLELGLLYDEFRDQWGPHGWANVYIPLKSGGGVVATVDVVNKLFLIRDPYHFSDWSADGDAAHLQDYYTLLSYVPQTSPPFSVTQSITHDAFRDAGIVNYFHP